VYTPITFVMNLKKYNSLTSAQRAAVDRAAMRAEGASRQYGTDNDANLLGKIKAASKGKVAFNNIDSAAFQAAAKPIAKEISKLVGDEAFVNAVLKAIQ
jgi:TRAP-type C4-dicarboxylate transport system substrate-binding protein